MFQVSGPRYARPDIFLSALHGHGRQPTEPERFRRRCEIALGRPGRLGVSRYWRSSCHLTLDIRNVSGRL